MNNIDNELGFLQEINRKTFFFRGFACIFELEPCKLQQVGGQFELKKHIINIIYTVYEFKICKSFFELHVL